MGSVIESGYGVYWMSHCQKFNLNTTCNASQYILFSRAVKLSEDDVREHDDHRGQARQDRTCKY